MNSWQLAQQIKHELATVTWPTGSQEVVFGTRSVFIYSGQPPGDDEIAPGFPFALIQIDAGTPDPDDPDLIQQTFQVTIACEVAGDPMGEHAVIGSSRKDLGRSVGAGSAEVSERVRAALQKLSGSDGASLIVTGSGITGPNIPAEGRHVTFETYTITAYCTSQLYWTPPTNLRRSGGNWVWTGSQCSKRFDFLRFRLGRVAGTAPVADPAQATIVYTGTATTIALAADAGFTYMIWADYDPRATGSVAYSSLGDTLSSYVVVT